MMRTRKWAILASAAAATVLCHRANAAVIAWTANTIHGDTDVIDPTGGEQLVAAYAFGNSIATAATVNGVSFSTFPTGTIAPNVDISFTSVYTPGPVPYNNYSASIPTSSTFSSNYQEILGQANYGGASGTITLTGLTQGDIYQVELWAEDDRGTTRSETFTATTSVTLAYDTTDTTGGFGQYAIGTFVADGTTQAIAVNATSPGNTVQLNDLELVQVPEPASLSLLGVASAAILMRRKRRGSLRRRKL